MLQVDAELADRRLFDFESAVLFRQCEIWMGEHSNTPSHPIKPVAAEQERFFLRQKQQVVAATGNWQRNSLRAIGVETSRELNRVGNGQLIHQVESLVDFEHHNSGRKLSASIG